MPEPNDHDDAQVVYSVRDLLADIKRDQQVGFAEVKGAIAAKADKADLARMEARLDQHGRELHGLAKRMEGVEDREHDREIKASVHIERDKKTLTTRQVAVRSAYSIIALAAAFLAPYFATHGF